MSKAARKGKIPLKITPISPISRTITPAQIGSKPSVTITTIERNLLCRAMEQSTMVPRKTLLGERREPLPVIAV